LARYTNSGQLVNQDESSNDFGMMLGQSKDAEVTGGIVLFTPKVSNTGVPALVDLIQQPTLNNRTQHHCVISSNLSEANCLTPQQHWGAVVWP